MLRRHAVRHHLHDGACRFQAGLARCTGMKIAIGLGLLALVGCAHEPTRAANVTSNPAGSNPAGSNPAGAKPAAAAPSTPSSPGDPSGGLKIDRSGSVEQQLARLQDAYDKNAEAIDFL